jgi:sirohydrochlorin ferrochelatase
VKGEKDIRNVLGAARQGFRKVPLSTRPDGEKAAIMEVLRRDIVLLEGLLAGRYPDDAAVRKAMARHKGKDDVAFKRLRWYLGEDDVSLGHRRTVRVEGA